MICLMSRQPRSTSRSCLSPRAMSSALKCGSLQRSRYLPSRFSSALILVVSMRSLPVGVVRRYRFRPGLAVIFPRSSPRLYSLRASVPSISSDSWATSCSRVCLSCIAASGVWQITNRSVSEIRTSLIRSALAPLAGNSARWALHSRRELSSRLVCRLERARLQAVLADLVDAQVPASAQVA